MKTVEFLGKVYVVEGTVGAPDKAIHLDTLSAAKLIELCNLLISNLDLGRRIKVFQSKAKGIKKVTGLLLKFDSAFDDDLPDSMQPDPMPEGTSVPSPTPLPDVDVDKPVKDAPTPKKAKIRDGSKQEALINMIKRAEGASIKEISDALGWVNHTVRGAISRDLKKRLGLPVTKTRVEGRGWVYSIAD